MSGRVTPTWTKARREGLARLLRSGLSIGKAAQALGVPRGSACWATARYGIGRAAADLSRATGKSRRRNDEWSEERLTERWAERRAV